MEQNRKSNVYTNLIFFPFYLILFFFLHLQLFFLLPSRYIFLPLVLILPTLSPAFIFICFTLPSLSLPSCDHLYIMFWLNFSLLTLLSLHLLLSGSSPPFAIISFSFSPFPSSYYFLILPFYPFPFSFPLHCKLSCSPLFLPPHPPNQFLFPLISHRLMLRYT
jgi:hypothetical protein